MIKKLLLVLSMCLVLSAETEFAEPEPSLVDPRLIVFSINTADDETIHHVLSVANNVIKFYGPDNVYIRIVAYYHGIKMVEKKHRKIAVRVDALGLLGVEFVACGNTMRTKKIKEEDLTEYAEVVTAGIVEITERVQAGWVYIAP
ncbi:MAG: intracellular sulfur oxidation DsrE/DsrF family protein [Sulfurimonas sp.]|jgi:intracellular sulfur oxidation DsrE/DsrF family protein|uniref:DsrE family protein n=1 Tax=Sulfurimonas sp. TaxID=2022749 RepID=UPI0039E41C18